ncbi:phosphoribosylanthranilate isomerase [candidate division KSB1 bacterium]|nr:phosphoribosylanthranilate isomerase [candidate division KSB1 bacterium]
MNLKIPRIKICCIQSIDEARLAIRYGASLVGLVSAMPSGPGPIPDTKIREIAMMIPPGITSVLLTSKTRIDEIIEQHCFCATNAIQLVDRLTVGTLSELRSALPGVDIIQVIHVTGDSAITDGKDAAPFVHAILLDSGNPNAQIKTLGGTGKTHNWQISRQIVEIVDVPVFLAGGLTPSNISQAIVKVHPFGVDVCSGVRSNVQLDENKLRLFTCQVRDVENSSAANI